MHKRKYQLKHVIKRFVAIYLIITLLAPMFCVTQGKESVKAASLPTVNEAEVSRRIMELARIFEVNDGDLTEGSGVQFTVNESGCSSKHATNRTCDNCKNSNVVQSANFKKRFGYTVNPSVLSRHYYETGSLQYAIGWTCHGFVSFALWYIGKADVNSTVPTKLVGTAGFTYDNLVKLGVKIGDVIRVDGHSMMFIEFDGTTGIKVLDCNAVNRVVADISTVKIRTARFSGSAMGVTRISNFVSDGSVISANVSEVSLNKANTTLVGIGSTTDLNATVKPANAGNKRVTWTSSNPSVATVDANGLVTAVGMGNTTVTVTTEDGNKTASCNVKVSNEALSVSLEADKTDMYLEDTIKLIAKASGGSENYTYSFLMYNEDTDSWYRFSDFKEENIFSWTAAKGGNRQFFVEVKDSEGDVVRSEGIKTTVADYKEFKINFEADSTTVTKGDKVKFVVNASGGNGQLVYSYLMYNDETGSWYRFSDFSDATALEWMAGSCGSRTFYVEVKDEKGNLVRSEGIKITVADELTVSLNSNANGVILGSNLGFSATASGGIGEYTYSFVMYNEAKETWYRFDDFKELNKLSWIASTTDTRTFYVEVKDGTGKVVRSEGITVNVLKDSDLEVSLSVSEDILVAGQYVELNAFVSGGIPEYTYSFLLYNVESGFWHRFSDFTSLDMLNWTATGTGRRQFYVEVKDGTGTVVRSAAATVTIE